MAANTTVETILMALNMKTIIIFVAGLLLTIFRNVLLGYLKRVFNKMIGRIQLDREHDELITLQYHEMFQTIEKVRALIKYTKFYQGKELDTTKSSMFVDFMNFKLDTIKKKFLQLILESPTAKDNDHLKNMIFDCIYSCVEEYTENAKVQFIKNGIPYSDAVYVVELFEQWRLDTVQVLGEQINGIFSSNFHPSRFNNLLAVLEVTSIAIALIPKDGIASFNAMNGKFIKVEYYERNK